DNDGSGSRGCTPFRTAGGPPTISNYSDSHTDTLIYFSCSLSLSLALSLTHQQTHRHPHTQTHTHTHTGHTSLCFNCIHFLRYICKLSVDDRKTLQLVSLFNG